MRPFFRLSDKIIEDKDKIEKRKQKFADTLQPFLEKYGKETLNDFYKYWTEPNKSNTKFKQEMQKTWDLSLRLNKWAENEEKFGTKKQEPIKLTTSLNFGKK